MIKRIKLSRGDVLVVTDQDGREILLAALKKHSTFTEDNELLLNLCDNSSGYNQTYNAHREIARLLDPDSE